jgi:hypothetical protein
MEAGSNISLVDTARQHWRLFIWSWIFPPVFLWTGLHIPFWISGVLFAAAFFVGQMASWTRGASPTHTAFWVMLVPFLIWVVVVFLNILVIQPIIRNAG